MSLPRIIKFSLFLILLTSFQTIGQLDSVNVIKSPYKKERVEHFEFGVFKRGYSSDSLKQILDKLENKRKDSWSRWDSLQFAEASFKVGNNELADYYFSYLDPDYKYERNFWWDYMILFILREQYREGLEKLNQDHPGVVELSEIYFFKKILIAKLANSKNAKWYKTNLILKWSPDSTLQFSDKKDPRFQDEILTPLNNLDHVLKRLIHHIYEDDPIISRACFEMSLIIEEHLSLSQTYIAMSLARHYNKWDKEILENLKRVKAKMLEKKYKIPNFRKYFPRIEYWRFDYNVLKEKKIQNKNRKKKEKPVLTKKVEKREFPFDPDLIVVFGIAFVFLMVILFLRPKKK